MNRSTLSCVFLLVGLTLAGRALALKCHECTGQQGAAGDKCSPDQFTAEGAPSKDCDAEVTMCMLREDKRGGRTEWKRDCAEPLPPPQEGEDPNAEQEDGDQSPRMGCKVTKGRSRRDGEFTHECYCDSGDNCNGEQLSVLIEDYDSFDQEETPQPGSGDATLVGPSQLSAMLASLLSAILLSVFI